MPPVVTGRDEKFRGDVIVVDTLRSGFFIIGWPIWPNDSLLLGSYFLPVVTFTAVVAPTDLY